MCQTLSTSSLWTWGTNMQPPAWYFFCWRHALATSCCGGRWKKRQLLAEYVWLQNGVISTWTYLAHWWKNYQRPHGPPKLKHRGAALQPQDIVQAADLYCLCPMRHDLLWFAMGAAAPVQDESTGFHAGSPKQHWNFTRQQVHLHRGVIFTFFLGDIQWLRICLWSRVKSMSSDQGIWCLGARLPTKT